MAIPSQVPPGLKRFHHAATILADAGTSLVQTSAELLEAVHGDGSRAAELEPLRWLATDHCDGEWAPEWVPPEGGTDAMAFYQYTSGTTQAPWGVVVSHANVLANEAMIQQAFAHDHTTLGLGWLPHFHDMGLVGNILQVLHIGRPCVLMSPVHFIQRPFGWLKAISDSRATSSDGPNFAYELCVQQISKAQSQSLDLSFLTLAFSGAEAVRTETIQRFVERFSGC